MKIQNHIYTFEDVKKVYSNYIKDPSSLALIEKAYRFADQKHEGQVRKSGDPYVSHCIGVAEILSELQAGPITICAGLLHDTMKIRRQPKKRLKKSLAKKSLSLLKL